MSWDTESRSLVNRWPQRIARAQYLSSEPGGHAASDLWGLGVQQSSGSTSLPYSPCDPPLQVTVIFKAHGACTEQKVYQAVTDDVPAAFMDGSAGGTSVRVEAREGGRVALHARHLASTVLVRQLGRYLTLAVRMPAALALAHDDSHDLQLCVSGCPAAERIADGPGTAQGPAGFTLQSARARCGDTMPQRDIYFQSCVFDLLTTGDTNFSAAALSALADVRLLHPRRERWHLPPRSGHAEPPQLWVGAGLLAIILALAL